MPQYEGATSVVGPQLFPGEGIWANAGEGSAGANGLKGPICMPGNYYSNPEVYDFELEPCPWTNTEDRRASIALYDYRQIDDDFEQVRTDGVSGISYTAFAPRSWRTSLIWWGEEVQVSVPSGNAFPFMLRLMGVGS